MEPIKYFFSYSRKDLEFVANLATDLKKAGVTIWLDKIDIRPGSRWDDSIESALNKSNGLLVALSTASIQSQNVMDEVSFARSGNKIIVPLLIENCTVPFRLARLQYIDFTGDYETAFKQLLEILNTNQATSGITGTESKAVINSPLEENPVHRNRSLKTYSEDNNAKPHIRKNINKLIGVGLIILAVIITVFNKCPSNIQYFIIYALIGIGISLLLVKSAERSTVNFSFQNVGLALGGGVALPFILFFTNPIGSFKPDDCQLNSNATSTTVFVHGRKSKQDMILRQKGFVIMDLGGERKRASINENGQAFFQNLHAGDKVRLAIDFSEPYKTMYPDSIYSIQFDSNIYLPVFLQGIDKVKGKVLYNDDPLEGVSVQIDTLTTITDKTGSFGFSIPEQIQTSGYTVWFTKNGFKTKSAPAFPQTGEPLNIVMEKK